MPVNFPQENYAPQGALAQAANFGMTPLNALFSGMQTRDVQDMRQKALVDAQEMIKQRQLENVQKQYEAQLAQAKMQSPSYIPAQLAGQEGQMRGQEVAGRKALALEPFVTRAEQAKATQETGDSGLESRINDLTRKQFDQTLPSSVREQAAIERQALVDTLSRNPKSVAGERLANIRGEYSLENTKLRVASAKELADLKAKATAGDKTAQQALVRNLNTMYQNGDLDHDQFMQELAKLQNAMNAAKIQPGVTVSPSVAPGVLEAKPPQVTYTPPNASKPSALPPGVTLVK